MITLKKRRGIPDFAFFAGDVCIPYGHPGGSRLFQSRLGKVIAQQLRLIGECCPQLRILQYCIMPDHVHILMFVERQLSEPVGYEIARLKNAVNISSGYDGVFADGYNDQLLKSSRSLDTLFNYIRQNPYRLAVRIANPDFFSRRDNLIVDGMVCQAYGNMQLLDNPFKEQVVVHRADSEAVFGGRCERWLYTAANGGVLVSPFISPRERDVRNRAECVGGRFILIRERPLGEREKPASRDFELCSAGRMLIIAPAEGLAMSRDTCLRLNALAGAVSSMSINL